jgi:hypothetical protein
VGKKPAEIQHEIEAKRAQIGAQIDGVQHRVRSDVTDLKQSAQDQASETINQTKSTLDVGAHAREHPLSMLTGALGVGVLLGAASEGLPGSGRRDQHNGQHNGNQQASKEKSDGFLGCLIMSTLGTTADTVRDELRELVKDGFSTFKSNTGMRESH